MSPSSPVIHRHQTQLQQQQQRAAGSAVMCPGPVHHPIDLLPTLPPLTDEADINRPLSRLITVTRLIGVSAASDDCLLLGLTISFICLFFCKQLDAVFN